MITMVDELDRTRNIRRQHLENTLDAIEEATKAQDEIYEEESEENYGLDSLDDSEYTLTERVV